MTPTAGRVGSRHSHTATALQHSAGNQYQRGMAIQAHAELTAIIVTANNFARNGTAREARQSRTQGPNRGCASNQRSHLGLPLEKQPAANNTKGTVGSRGIKAPINPSNKLTHPANSHRVSRQRSLA